MVANRVGACAPTTLAANKYHLAAADNASARFKAFRRSQRLEIALEKLRGADDINIEPTYHTNDVEKSHLVSSGLRVEIMQPSIHMRKEMTKDTAEDRLDTEENREVTNVAFEDKTRQNLDKDMIAAHQYTPQKTPAQSCSKERFDSSTKDSRKTILSFCDEVKQRKVNVDSLNPKEGVGTRKGQVPSSMNSTIHVNPSISSEESGKDTATYSAFTDSSVESDSSSDGYSTESSTKNKKLTTAATNEEEKHSKGTFNNVIVSLQPVS